MSNLQHQFDVITSRFH